MQFAIFIGLLITGYSTGRYFELRHFKRLRLKEEELKHIALISTDWKSEVSPDQEGTAVSAGVVLGSDYFKTFASSLRNLLGGRVKSFESLLDRGRREAIVRMKLKAQEWGASKVVNVRIETANVGTGQGRKGLPCVEFFAYGTALRERVLSEDVNSKS